MSVLWANIFSSKCDCRSRPFYRPCMCMLYLPVLIYVMYFNFCYYMYGCIRDGPFDIQGGGGGWHFFEKNSLFPVSVQVRKK